LESNEGLGNLGERGGRGHANSLAKATAKQGDGGVRVRTTKTRHKEGREQRQGVWTRFPKGGTRKKKVWRQRRGRENGGK